MSTVNNDEQKIIMQQITPSDTISEFMEKCNNNFLTISEKGGGPVGTTGEKGSQGVPTKPKVPIHIWKKGTNTDYEEKVITIGVNKIETTYEITEYADDLSNPKYQEGHLIILDNSHVYILKNDDIENKLVPTYAFNMSIKIEDGKNSYVHFKYANEKDLIDNNIITDSNYYDYIGVCSNHSENAPGNYSNYSWNKINDKNINIEYIDKNTLQGSEFTKKIFSKQITSSSGFIVDSLNTEPENNKNKVIIGGNNIKIINDDGNTSILITSDDVTSELDTTEYNSNEINTIYADVSLSSLSSHQLISPYEEIDKNLKLISINGSISIINSENTINQINDGDIYIKIEYFIEEENVWKEYKEDDFVINYSTNNFVLKFKDDSDYSDLLLNNRIRFKTIINNINYTKSEDGNVDILLTTNYTYSYTEESNNTTKIGKDGIVVKLNNEENDNKSEFHVGKDEILMKVGTFGLKITNEGIFKIINGVEESLLS